MMKNRLYVLSILLLMQVCLCAAPLSIAGNTALQTPHLDRLAR